MASHDQTNLSDSSSSEYKKSSSSEYEKWKAYIIDIENEPEDRNTRKWNIYRVPCNLSNLKKDAYTPQLVTIGPIHHDLGNLNPMQDQKLRYLKLFWSRVENKIKAMDEFKNFLEHNEERIRRCYARNICDNIEKEKFVDMMLLDSVFIIELFLRIQSQKTEDNVVKQTDSDDIILKQPWLNKSIQRDLLLLENQIPLFILKELYNTFVPVSDPVKKKRSTFIELAYHYFECYDTYKIADSSSNQETACSSSVINREASKNCNNSVSDLERKSSLRFEQLKKSWDSKPQHFTDLIRSFYICEGLRCRCHHKKESSLRTATKLREAGVSFQKVDNKPLLDIKFRRVPILSWFLCFGCLPKSSYFKARLQIPELKVDDTTECILRNLIAFEQCHYPDQPYICNYVSFIDSLIHTKDDVELLVEKEVIVHELGSDKEVATLVNGLCKHVVADKTCYGGLIIKLNTHYQRQWNRTMAALRLVYFRDAWRASSTLVATAVLVFTIFNFCRVVKLVLDLEGGKKP